MATIKKSAKSAPKMMKPVAPAKKGIPAPPPMAASPMGAAGQGPMMKFGGNMKKETSGKKAAKASVKMAKKKANVKVDKSSTMKSGGAMKKCKYGCY